MNWPRNLFQPLLITAGVCVVAVLGVLFWRGSHTATRASGPVHVVLLGASIGQGWKLSQWPQRTGMRGVTAEALAAWQFDKSELLAEVLARPRVKIRPTRSFLRALWSAPPPADVVIIKECSAYFPGELTLYQRRIEQWVNEIRARGKVAALATVVPITRARAAREPAKQTALRTFNEWVRDYARRSGVPLLDLAAPLQTGEGAYLRDDLAQPDGSHLNAQAYAILDQLLVEVLFSPAVFGSLSRRP